MFSRVQSYFRDKRNTGPQLHKEITAEGTRRKILSNLSLGVSVLLGNHAWTPSILFNQEGCHFSLVAQAGCQGLWTVKSA